MLNWSYFSSRHCILLFQMDIVVVFLGRRVSLVLALSQHLVGWLLVLESIALWTLFLESVLDYLAIRYSLVVKFVEGIWRFVLRHQERLGWLSIVVDISVFYAISWESVLDTPSKLDDMRLNVLMLVMATLHYMVVILVHKLLIWRRALTKYSYVLMAVVKVIRRSLQQSNLVMMHSLCHVLQYTVLLLMVEVLIAMIWIEG